MIKIIMRRVPKRIDKSLQHKVMKSWSETIVESHSASNNIRIISVKELSETIPDITISSKNK